MGYYPDAGLSTWKQNLGEVILQDKDPIENKLNLLGFMGYPRLSSLQYL
jgi:hypothetical protein